MKTYGIEIPQPGITEEEFTRRTAMVDVEIPKPYKSWLEYAVATMDTRTPYIESCMVDGPCVERKDIRAAAEKALRLYEAALKAATARMEHEDSLGKGETFSDGMDKRLRLYDVMVKAEAEFKRLAEGK